MQPFIKDTVFKRDIFSETWTGHFDGAPDSRIIFRNVAAAPLWSRPLAWLLARREIRALKIVKGIDGAPQLLHTDASGLYRTWTEGAPLQLARPDHAAFYRDARRILRAMRRRGITHNDLAKPQNWLMRPDGRAAVIDFQLASVHRRRGPLFRMMAYEDLRHLLKQKRSFAPNLLTPREKSVLATKSLPARLWLKSVKPVYNFVTRTLFHWSDGEGTNDRLDLEGPSIVTALKSVPGVSDVTLLTYAQSNHGTGLYVFAEGSAAAPDLRAALGKLRVEQVQPVASLPRKSDGAVRTDLLRLVALNQMTELDAILASEPQLAAVLRPIIAGRLNFTDRRDVRNEG
ncbi:MAG: serine/threonine protein kinase [Rhizobiaceae bacterium]